MYVLSISKSFFNKVQISMIRISVTYMYLNITISTASYTVGNAHQMTHVALTTTLRLWARRKQEFPCVFHEREENEEGKVSFSYSVQGRECCKSDTPTNQTRKGLVVYTLYPGRKLFTTLSLDFLGRLTHETTRRGGSDIIMVLGVN